MDVDLAIFAEIDENDPAGIFETQDKAQELDVFPNPAGSLISIRGIEAIRGASYSIEVYNASGQLVQTHLSTGLSLKTIDVSNLPPGFYLLKVLSENLTAQSRFIKM